MITDDFKTVTAFLLTQDEPSRAATEALSRLEAEFVRLDRIEASATVMRKALECVQHPACAGSTACLWEISECSRACTALATDAGAGLLARLREAEGRAVPVHIGEALGLMKARAEKAEAEVERLREKYETRFAEALAEGVKVAAIGLDAQARREERERIANEFDSLGKQEVADHIRNMGEK